MNIYKAISLEPKMLCCSCFYQVGELESNEGYIKALNSLLQYFDKETDKLEKNFQKFNDKFLNKNTEMLVTILGEYLQTPLRKDEEEIRKVLRENLEKIVQEFSLNIRYGIEMSYISEIVFVPTQYALLKRLEKAGMDYLKFLGFEAGKENQKIIESVFIFEGSVNLDLIEFILGKKKFNSQLHILGLANSNEDKAFNGLYNIVYSSGASVMKLFEKEVFETTLLFSRPSDIEEDQFLGAVTEALDKLWVSFRIPYITLMKKKLGLSRGDNMMVRIFFPEEQEQLTETLRWLSMYKEVGFVRQALIDDGKLINKKIIK
ncbi:MAG: hypothetical protein IGBAC_1309 [Ignavibacteriae bacterium]|nr:MAG: hypothetical protein IGBAC_1309 [Ignavibacteriota bacterium]